MSGPCSERRVRNRFSIGILDSAESQGPITLPVTPWSWFDWGDESTVIGYSPQVHSPETPPPPHAWGGGGNFVASGAGAEWDRAINGRRVLNIQTEPDDTIASAYSDYFYFQDGDTGFDNLWGAKFDVLPVGSHSFPGMSYTYLGDWAFYYISPYVTSAATGSKLCLTIGLYTDPDNGDGQYGFDYFLLQTDFSFDTDFHVVILHVGETVADTLVSVDGVTVPFSGFVRGNYYGSTVGDPQTSEAWPPSWWSDSRLTTLTNGASNGYDYVGGLGKDSGGGFDNYFPDFGIVSMTATTYAVMMCGTFPPLDDAQRLQASDYCRQFFVPQVSDVDGLPIPTYPLGEQGLALLRPFNPGPGGGYAATSSSPAWSPTGVFQGIIRVRFGQSTDQSLMSVWDGTGGGPQSWAFFCQDNGVLNFSGIHTGSPYNLQATIGFTLPVNTTVWLGFEFTPNVGAAFYRADDSETMPALWSGWDHFGDGLSVVDSPSPQAALLAVGGVPNGSPTGYDGRAKGVFRAALFDNGTLIADADFSQTGSPLAVVGASSYTDSLGNVWTLVDDAAIVAS